MSVSIPVQSSASRTSNREQSRCNGWFGRVMRSVKNVFSHPVTGLAMLGVGATVVALGLGSGVGLGFGIAGIVVGSYLVLRGCAPACHQRVRRSMLGNIAREIGVDTETLLNLGPDQSLLSDD